MSNINEKFKDIASQFSDLKGLHPGLWPIAPRLAAVLGLFALTLGLGYVALWSDQLSELEHGQQEEAKLKETYKTKMQQSINLDALVEQRKLVLQYVSRMEKQLPATAQYAELLGDINSAANGRGLSMDVFEPGQVVVKAYYAELPITIKMLANYHDLGQFVADVAKLPRIFTFNNLIFTVSKDAKRPGIILDGTAKTYRYLDPEEVAKQEADKKKAKEAKK
ncbi:MAG: type 4a pilus biogenesis protein PilO [Undibacterium sp.]|nr:type 4a pilus biogenesis protein PilO [Undibacterium sp.]